MKGVRLPVELNMSLIDFKWVSFNRLRSYLSSRRMHYPCRLNMWSSYVLSVGIFYRGLLCGGCLVSDNSGIAKIETWYSREDRAKMELLDYVIDMLVRIGYTKVWLPVQRKWIGKLVNDGWKQDGRIFVKEI